MFKVNHHYTKKDVKKIIGLPEHIVRANSTYYDYGYPQYNGIFYFYVNLGAAGTTGHDYPNELRDDGMLFWTAPKKTRIQQPKMKEIISKDFTKLLFVRYDNRSDFVYMGNLILNEVVQEEFPVILTFQLIKVDAEFEINHYLDAEEVFKRKTSEYYAKNKHKLYHDLRTAPEKPLSKTVTTNYYFRSSSLKSYVNNRAKGYCELCKTPAPFKRYDGSPYLELHHIIQLSDQGVDKVYNCVALCPNCHRELHYGELSELKEKNITRILYQSLLDDENFTQEDLNQFIEYHDYKESE
ncbi:hypothetical protein CI105_01825 [Candidatus Izimaplasma bacterium ZiA1]|uniref:HNH endonuclease n=1 Tax=Candidatus Izimoplasma sp. ZiA1 TaxID=2024899 RepID=UPI000BAA4A9E|nr:hypothetical protein CI105_01825 [Candidatus Izimaplasma bacterium ZiA1]